MSTFEDILINDAYTSPGSGLSLTVNTGGGGGNFLTFNGVETTTNKTLVSPYITQNLRIYDPTLTYNYKITPSSITANRTLDIPLITSDDTFAVVNLQQELYNKSFATPVSVADTASILPGASSLLELQSTNKALLLTRHTTAEQGAITAPVNGMITYDTDTARFDGYTDAGWEPLHKPRYGNYYISTPVETDIATPGVNVFTKVAGTSTSVSLSTDVTMSANNRLAYGGSKSRTFKIECTLTATTATGNKTYEFGIYKNGTTLLTGSCQTVYLSTNKDNNTSLLICDTANKNDYYEVWVRNITDTTNLTVDKLSTTINSID